MQSQHQQRQPAWILRHHAPEAIHSLRAISTQKEGAFVLVGDASGHVSLTSLTDYRPRCFWQPHSKSILGIDLVQGEPSGNACVLSQGRDNKLVASLLPATDSASNGGLPSALPSRIKSNLPPPTVLDRLDINALNFCPFACISTAPREQEEDKAGKNDAYLVAVPHTVDSAYIDIYSLPSKQRVVRALGKADIESERSALGHRKGIVMSLSLFRLSDGGLALVAGYEDGYVKLWRIKEEAGTLIWPWELVWSERKHLESVLALAVSPNFDFAVSVGADDRLVRYELDNGKTSIAQTKTSGHASITVRQDGRLVAIGGWDGRIRTYDDALTLKDTLRYHKDTVQALAFLETRKDLCLFRREPIDDSDDDDEQDDDDDEVIGASARSNHQYNAGLLVSGAKDGRVCLWKTS